MPERYDRLARASFRRGQRRRTRILLFLVSAVVTSMIVAIVAGAGWWDTQIALDFSLAIYAALLIEAKRRREERFAKVRTITRPTRHSTRDAVVLEHANVNHS
ncbi:MAG: hypothetical protein QOC87_1375 [Actinomycetota bacterium]|jgi:uncharacterized ion transporter superfamily protein YfcC|nr:hypothetical protein [Actinomycetota bacterium]